MRRSSCTCCCRASALTWTLQCQSWPECMALCWLMWPVRSGATLALLLLRCCLLLLLLGQEGGGAVLALLLL